MGDVDDALAANRAAVMDLVASAERSASTWSAPRAPGKWSPSQVVEHVARGLDEGANIVSGTPTIPMPGAVVRLVARLFFYRILKKDAFPNRVQGSQSDEPSRRTGHAGRGARPPGRGLRPVRRDMPDTGRQRPTRHEFRFRHRVGRRLRQVQRDAHSPPLQTDARHNHLEGRPTHRSRQRDARQAICSEGRRTDEALPRASPGNPAHCILREHPAARAHTHTQIQGSPVFRAVDMLRRLG